MRRALVRGGGAGFCLGIFKPLAQAEHLAAQGVEVQRLAGEAVHAGGLIPAQPAERAGGGAVPRQPGTLRHQPLHGRHSGAGARAAAA